MSFNIIHHKGRVNQATTLHGIIVERQEQLFVREWGSFIPCAPYDEQFIYQNDEIGQSSYMCTCGSPAVVANPERGSGRMFVCLFHATFGAHSTSFVNMKDWPNVADQTLEINPDKAKWI